MTAVSNASPLFARVGRLDLLGEIYSTVFVPPAVWREVVEAGARPGAAAIAQAAWLQRRTIATPPSTIRGTERIGPGEAEAIALASEFAGSVPLLLDDLKGRRVASELGLPVVGSAGALVAAKDLGLIIAVRPLLEELRFAGLHLSHQAFAEVLMRAGELSSTGEDR